MNSLTNNLMRDGYLKSESVIEAFSDIERIEFVPHEFELQANANIPIPVGCGQTISQPVTAATMLELLDVQKNNNVLNVGSASGWVTALLAHIVGEEGKVTAVEIIPELVEMSRENVSKFGFVQGGIVEVHEGNGSVGYDKNSPYDRILVSASVEEVPEDLEKQLKIGGKMVIPIHNKVCYLKKTGENDFYKEEFSGFAFTPLIQKM